jgi:hypothetical protein
MSTKTMSSSRAKPTPTISINQENYRAFTKEDIADELHHYQELCLKLRKDNHELKEKL